MPSLFQVPTPTLGLMGRRRQTQQNPLAALLGQQIPVYEQAQFDAGDQQFLDASMAAGQAPPTTGPSGVSLDALANYRAPASAAPASAAPAQAQAPTTPQRERVSGWRLLDRVLGGQTVTEGLDAERARLTQEALLPQARQRQEQLRMIAESMGPQALAAYTLNPEKFGENLAERFGTSVVGPGAGLFTDGRRVGEQATYDTSGDTTLRRTSQGVEPVFTRTAPSIKEQTDQFAADTGRINANNPINVAQNGLLVDPRTGQTIAQGYRPPDIQNVTPGSEALIFSNGNLTGRIASTQQRPPTASQLKRADDLELQITQDQTAIDRVAGLLGRIESGQIDINPAANVSARVRNALGMSNENSLGLAEIRTTVEALRNSILQDANGVQTEGDAVRALNAILAGINDPDVVAQGFREFLRAKTRINETRQQQLERMQGSSAAPPLPPGFVLDQ